MSVLISSAPPLLLATEVLLAVTTDRRWNSRWACSASRSRPSSCRAFRDITSGVAGAFHGHARLGDAPGDLLISPAAVAMLVFAGPLTATIFGYGAFTGAHDVRDGELRADGLLVGLAGLQPGQGAGARIFRAPGHADAGARRPASRSGVNMSP